MFYLKKKKIPYKIIYGLFLLIFTSTFPVIFLYLQNIGEVSISESFLPCITFILISVFILCISYINTKDINNSILISFVFIVMFMNYTYIEKMFLLLPIKMYFWHTIPISIYIFIIISILINNYKNTDIKEIIVKTLNLVFLMLIMINIIFKIPSIWKNNRSNNIINNSISKQEIGLNHNNPNVYLFIFDEYAGFNSVKNIFEYDNSEFYNYLDSKGFTVSLNSSNYTPSTHTAILNIFSMDYLLNDNMDTMEKYKLSQTNNLLDVFRTQGYTIRGIGETLGFGISSDTNNTSFESTSIEGDNFFNILIKKTLLYPFFLNNSQNEKVKNVESALKYIQNKNNIPSSPTFTFFYIKSPHIPFVFKENGSYNMPSDYNDWSNQNLYLGEYKFITDNIKNIVDVLLKYDSDSIIILMSDHSARGNGIETIVSYEDSIDILHAIYFGGNISKEFENLSGVNTMRKLSDKMFNTEFNIVEVPIIEE